MSKYDSEERDEDSGEQLTIGKVVWMVIYGGLAILSVSLILYGFSRVAREDANTDEERVEFFKDIPVINNIIPRASVRNKIFERMPRKRIWALIGLLISACAFIYIMYFTNIQFPKINFTGSSPVNTEPRIPDHIPSYSIFAGIMVICVFTLSGCLLPRYVFEEKKHFAIALIVYNVLLFLFVRYEEWMINTTLMPFRKALLFVAKSTIDNVGA